LISVPAPGMLLSARAASVCRACARVSHPGTLSGAPQSRGFPPGPMLVATARSLCCREPPHQPQRIPCCPHCACVVTVMRASPPPSCEQLCWARASPPPSCEQLCWARASATPARLREVERARQEPAEARRDEGLPVGGPRQEVRGRVAVPLVADAHEGRVGARRQLHTPLAVSAAASTRPVRACDRETLPPSAAGRAGHVACIMLCTE